MKIKYLFILVIIAVIQSCLTIKHSSLRIPNREAIIIDNCKISSTGAVYLNLIGILKGDLIPSSIKIEFNGY